MTPSFINQQHIVDRQRDKATRVSIPSPKHNNKHKTLNEIQLKEEIKKGKILEKAYLIENKI